MFQTVLTVAGVAILLAVLWVARDALLLIYVSALLAMGISPLVRLLEHPSSRSRRRFRLPRWLAILAIYLAVIGIVTVLGLLIVPPLVTQASALWRKLPDELEPVPGLPDRTRTDDAQRHARGSGVAGAFRSGLGRRRHGAGRGLERDRRLVRG